MASFLATQPNSRYCVLINEIAETPTRPLHYAIQSAETGALESLPPPSPEPEPATRPDAPAAPGLTVVDQSIRITWTTPAEDGGSRITGYELQRKLVAAADSTYMTLSVARNGLNLTHTDAGLAAETAYTYRVRAINAIGRGAFSVAISAITDPEPATRPDAPHAPGLTAMVHQSIRIAWRAPDDGGSPITGYELQRKLAVAADSTYTAVALAGDGLSRRHTDTGLAAETAYAYRVRAVNAIGRSAFSAVNAVTTTPVTRPDAPAPQAPTPTLTVLDHQSIRVDFDWVEWPAQYKDQPPPGWSDRHGHTYSLNRVQSRDPETPETTVALLSYHRHPSSPILIDGVLTVPTYTESGLSPNTAYHYRICIYIPSSTHFCAYASATTDPAPDAPGDEFVLTTQAFSLVVRERIEQAKQSRQWSIHMAAKSPHETAYTTAASVRLNAHLGRFPDGNCPIPDIRLPNDIIATGYRLMILNVRGPSFSLVTTGGFNGDGAFVHLQPGERYCMIVYESAANPSRPLNYQVRVFQFPGESEGTDSATNAVDGSVDRAILPQVQHKINRGIYESIYERIRERQCKDGKWRC